MKTTLLAATLVIMSQTCFAQEEKPKVQPASTTPQVQYNNGASSQTVVNKTVVISKRPGEAQRTHNEAYYNEEIAKVDTHIAAIDSKVASVNADPVEKAEALSNGWFESMDQIKSDLQAKRTELVTKRNNL